MKKSRTTNPKPKNGSGSNNYAPSDEQIGALARRLMPEIKKFFADKQIQQEFVDWQEKQNAVK
jgi:hypothetical protein